jgi:hypothetical protein
VEELPIALFAGLGENDILFIDFSYVLRVGGDAWFEYLHVLPNLKPGVLVHIHDIFQPYLYPEGVAHRAVPLLDRAVSSPSCASKQLVF